MHVARSLTDPLVPIEQTCFSQAESVVRSPIAYRPLPQRLLYNRRAVCNEMDASNGSLPDTQLRRESDEGVCMSLARPHRVPRRSLKGSEYHGDCALLLSEVVGWSVMTVHTFAIFISMNEAINRDRNDQLKAMFHKDSSHHTEQMIPSRSLL